MITYYDITNGIREFLQNDEDINYVNIGGLDDTDIDKQRIFPMANILVTFAEFINGVVRFTVEVSVMDVVDIRKDNKDALPPDERWKGQDNKQDILNAMLSVIERLERHIRKGELSKQAYSLESNSAEPFEVRFENLLTGWTSDLVIDVPNNVQNC